MIKKFLNFYYPQEYFYIVWKISEIINIENINGKGYVILKNKVAIQIKPIEPAVNPTAKKKENSSKSLGKELTNKFSWVI